MTDKTELNIANQYFRLAIEYTKQTKLDQAIEAYHSAILIDSEQASVYNNLGLLYAQKGNLFKAVQSYLKEAANVEYNSISLGLMIMEKSLSLQPQMIIFDLYIKCNCI